MKRTRGLSSPIRANVELTRDCNYRCVHCYNPGRFEKADDMKAKKEDLMRIIDVLGEKNVFHIVLSGGEPFLDKKKVFEAVKRCKRYNMQVSINTNAAFIDKRTARTLKRLGVDYLTISLPSGDEETNVLVTQKQESFSKTVCGIKNCVAAGLKVSVNIVVNKLNLKTVRETVRILSGIGVASAHLSPFILQKSGGSGISLSREETLDLLDQARRLRKEFSIVKGMIGNIPHCIAKKKEQFEEMTNTCSAGNAIIGIDPEGKATACPHLSVFEGNILKEGFDAVWARMDPWRNDKYLPKDCKACVLVDSCRGGCRASAYYGSGRLDAKEKQMRKPLKRKKKEDTALRPDDIYKVIDGIRFREENKGYVIYQRQHLFLNKEQLRFLSHLKKLGEFGMKKAAETTDLRKQDISRLIFILKKTGFLKTIRRDCAPSEKADLKMEKTIQQQEVGKW